MALCIGVVTGLDVLAYARKGVRRDWVRDTPRNGGWNLPMIIVFLLSLSLFTGLREIGALRFVYLVGCQ